MMAAISVLDMVLDISTKSYCDQSTFCRADAEQAGEHVFFVCGIRDPQTGQSHMRASRAAAL